MKCKTLLSSASTLISVFVGGAAFAQQPPAPTHQEEAENAIADIIVTAQRRAENLQKSSLPISAVTGDALEAAGVTQPTDLTRLVAGVQIGAAGVTAQPYIRGVGNASNTGASTSGVAFNLDGIYLGQPQTYGLSFYDLARVEVVKGPQGTLYGRNATGGAINLITNEPTGETGGNISFDVGNYQQIKATGAVNLALAEDLALRAAFNIINRDGYYDDGSGDDVQQSARLRLKWTPANVKLLLNLEYNHVGGVGGGAAINDGTPSGGTRYNIVTPWAGMASPDILANYVSAVDKSGTQFQKMNVFTASADLTVDLGNDTSATLLPAYRDVSFKTMSYSSMFGFFPIGSYRYKQSSVEGRLNHDGPKWKWVLGLYYYNQDQNTPYHVDTRVMPDGALPPPLGTAISLDVSPSNQNTRSYAGFGHASYSLTSALRVIAGLRYTEETTKGSGTQTFYSKLFGVCSTFAPCVSNFTARIKSENVSWKAGVEYDLAPDSMLFATVGTGFKAGGVLPAAAPRNTYRPEKLLAYEVGMRNRFFDQRVQLNLEAFLWKYKDKQETIAGYDGDGTATGGSLTNLTVNAGRATIYGAAVDLIVRATRNDTLHVGVEYNHTNYDEYKFTSPTQPVTGCAVTPPDSESPLYRVDCSGKPLTRAPLWSGIADYEHVFPLDSGARIVFGASANFASSRYLEVGFLPYLKAPSYVIGNLDLTYEAPGAQWSVTAYVRNVSDEVVPVNTYPSNYSAQPLVSGATLQPPRTYGLRASFRF